MPRKRGIAVMCMLTGSVRAASQTVDSKEIPAIEKTVADPRSCHLNAPFRGLAIHTLARDALRMTAATAEFQGAVWLVRNLDKLIRR